MTVPACTAQTLAVVRQFEDFLKTLPQVRLTRENLLHAGCYCRTLYVPAGLVLTGALMKLPTILIVSGHVLMTVGNQVQDVEGYRVMACEAGRKTAFRTLADTVITCVFATNAASYEEAVGQMTDDTLMEV
ncbi:MAG: hypothetical protein IJ233_10955 [Pyramidobacter sp.]|nr:hypothetical protein [Pyramidobacter sp.]